ncbi:MAG TPA: DUF4260 domain-containing protein [Terracidiphilus sp.]|nr:DUF4260 domain-containing protein [Terracidiphilus sp.]
MASSASSLSPLATDFGVRGSVLAYLKLEGLAVAGLAAVLYAHLGASWWLFVAVWLVPDLSMLGYLAGSCWGARIYNVVHSYVLPIALGLTALLLHAQALLPLALIWANHIGVDRMLGYGLKYSNGFGWTHLGKLGKKNVSTAAE